MPQRAVIYRRVSDPKQEEEGHSLISQQKDCMGYCKERGYVVVADIQDVHTGSEMDERIGLARVRQMMRRRQFDVLVAARYDRVDRDPMIRAVIKYEAKTADIRIEYVVVEFENSPAGEMMEQMYSTYAKLEAQFISARTQRGLKERVERGLPLVGASAPYGYYWEDEEHKTHLVPHPERAEVVRWIFETIANGTSLRGMAHLLNQRGVESPRGKGTWEPSSLRRIVGNPLYWGEPGSYRTRTVRERRHTHGGEAKTVTRVLPTPERIILTSTEFAPPLVAKEIAARAQAVIQSRRVHTGRPANQPERYLLRGGFIRCGICGNALTCYMNNGNQPTYRCTAPAAKQHRFNYIVAQTVDDWIWAKAQVVLRHPEILDERVRMLEEGYGEVVGSEIAALEADIADIEERKANAEEAVVALGIKNPANSGLVARIQELSDVLLERQARRATLDNDLSILDAVREQVSYVQSWAAQNADAELSYEDRRLALYLLGTSVRLWPKDTDPRYEHAFNPLEVPKTSYVKGRPTPSASTRLRVPGSLCALFAFAVAGDQTPTTISSAPSGRARVA